MALCRARHLEPITKIRTELQGKISPVEVSIYFLGLVEIVEIPSDFGTLLFCVIEKPHPLHELDAHVIRAVDERLVGYREVKLVQRSLRQQSPKPRVRVVLDKRKRLRQRDGIQQFPHVAQRLGFEFQAARGI